MINDISEEELVPIQDSVRENQLISLFKLRPNPNRLGPDAYDENEHPFELKTTTQSGVGTARDVSIDMITEWRRRYWIIAKGINLKSGFKIENIYFLSPSMMDGILTQIENKIKPDITLRDKLSSLLEGECSSQEIERFRYLMSRGATLNNPKIPWHYVEKNGIEIAEDHHKELRKLVKKYPL